MALTKIAGLQIRPFCTFFSRVNACLVSITIASKDYSGEAGRYALHRHLHGHCGTIIRTIPFLPFYKQMISRYKLTNSFVLFACLWLAGCGNSSSDRFQKAYNQALEKQTKNSTQDKKEEAPSIGVKITTQNAKEVLTKYGQENPEKLVQISTRLGDIKIRLYDDTPLHRANFVMLTKKKFYNETEFNRVVKDFMIQGGDSDKRKMRIPRYLIPMELNPGYFHKRGAVAMAKNDNETGSSSHYFYIVQGVKLTDPQLDAIEKEFHTKFSPAQRSAYKTVGGVPQLDGKYTVFGEVVEGLNVVNKIAALKTDKEDWPLDKVAITASVLPQ
jgi:cyclophilin family peptidyl-prolyl cis-trans isomerase